VEWKFEDRMEDMSDEEIRTRLEAAQSYEVAAKIKPIPYIGDENAIVTYESAELVARCPVTGYPDLYQIKFELVPGEWIPELKTLKFYLMAYVDLPISHEHLASKIYHDFRSAVGPTKLRVTLDVAIRGGIKTTVVLGEM
jgi:7-cyano-7-deazaguanine reductase